MSTRTIIEPSNARRLRTRAKLLDAARSIVERDGLDALTIAAVAGEAAVTRCSPSTARSSTSGTRIPILRPTAGGSTQRGWPAAAAWPTDLRTSDCSRPLRRAMLKSLDDSAIEPTVTAAHLLRALDDLLDSTQELTESLLGVGYDPDNPPVGPSPAPIPPMGGRGWMIAEARAQARRMGR